MFYFIFSKKEISHLLYFIFSSGKAFTLIEVHPLPIDMVPQLHAFIFDWILYFIFEKRKYVKSNLITCAHWLLATLWKSIWIIMHFQDRSGMTHETIGNIWGCSRSLSVHRHLFLLLEEYMSVSNITENISLNFHYIFRIVKRSYQHQL